MKTRFRLFYFIAILGLLLQGVSYAENNQVAEPPHEISCQCTWIGQRCSENGWGRLCVPEGNTVSCRSFDHLCDREHNLERD